MALLENFPAGVATAPAPTLPGLRRPGGSRFDAIWWAASVIP
jgi:hypothetical protein